MLKIEVFVWFTVNCHVGLIYKHLRNGIYRNKIEIINDLLINRKERAVLNVKYSSWVDIWAGLAQESIGAPLLVFKMSMTYQMVLETNAHYSLVINIINTFSSDIKKA